MQTCYIVPEHLTETFDKLTKKAKQTSPNSMFELIENEDGSYSYFISY